MSTLKVDNIRHNNATTDALVLSNDGSVAIGTCTAKITSVGGGGLSHRNILINGSCAISQRGSSFSGTGFTLDRYYVGSGDYSVAQVTDAPSNSGLIYSLRVSRTASTTGYLTFQMIELPATGQAGQFYNGAKFTLSGYVKGTSGATIVPTLRFSTGTNGSNGSSFTRTEGAFTCNGSWQPFTFHFTVDENVGGSDKCVQSYFTFVTTATGQNVFFTGLQLEAGDTATSFEHRSISEELLRCQRYFKRMRGAVGGGGGYGSAGDGAVATLANWTGSGAYGLLPLGVEMRYAPKLTGFANLNYFCAGSTFAPANSSQCYLAGSSYDRVELTLQGMSMTQGHAGWLRIDNPSGYMDFDAEL